MANDDGGQWNDLIEANQDARIRVLTEALRRLLEELDCSELPRCKRAVAIIEAARQYHPMHEEDWCGWPGKKAEKRRREGSE